MNRGQTLIDYLESYGLERTLGQIQEEFSKTSVAYSMSQAVSEAREILKRRRLPQTIVCQRGKEPYLNKYRIEPLLELFVKQED